jgi:outer membrane protein OmpA-like peptidoglycan-associated protein
MIRKLLVLSLCAVFVLGTLSGCGSMKKRDKGAIIGAVGGAAAGAAVGKAAGNTAVGAILGAVVGGAAGAYIGNYMDKQAEEIRNDIEGATVERVGEGIKITFASGILFDIDKSNLRPVAQQNITELSRILKKYDDTKILIEGHTDATGPEDYNMDLSIRRAQSVMNYLTAQEVMPTRITVQGYGEEQPVADNQTADGRQQNRRVEIAIFANDKLKAEAKKQVTEG